MNCLACGKPIDPDPKKIKDAIRYPTTDDPNDAHYYCNWECLIKKLDATLAKSRKILKEIKKVIR